MAKKKDIAGKIEINLDKKCSQCGATGAMSNGMCMKCVADKITESVTDKDVFTVHAWIEKTCNLVQSVLIRNAGGIEKIRKHIMSQDEPEGMKLAISVGMSPEMTPKIEVSLRYSETYKDSVEGMADNPDQGKLELGQ